MSELIATRGYVAGPYSNGDTLTQEERLANAEIAMRAGDLLLDYGYAPFVPHLAHFMDKRRARAYDEWLQYGLEWMRPCHFTFLLPGKSEGAKGEAVFAAAKLEIPVFETMKTLIATVPTKLPEGPPAEVVRGAMEQIKREQMTEMLSDD